MNDPHPGCVLIPLAVMLVVAFGIGVVKLMAWWNVAMNGCGQ